MKVLEGDISELPINMCAPLGRSLGSELFVCFRPSACCEEGLVRNRYMQIFLCDDMKKCDDLCVYCIR